MTLQDEAKLYVEALQSPANAWGVQMVPYMGFINRKVQKKWTTSDSFRRTCINVTEYKRQIRRLRRC